jgi:hypothetical protein
MGRTPAKDSRPDNGLSRKKANFLKAILGEIPAIFDI